MLVLVLWGSIGTPRLSQILVWDFYVWCHKCWSGTILGDVANVGVTNFDLTFQAEPGTGHESAGHRRAERKEADQPEVVLAQWARVQGGVPD